jgi:hypothetical protein
MEGCIKYIMGMIYRIYIGSIWDLYPLTWGWPGVTFMTVKNHGIFSAQKPPIELLHRVNAGPGWGKPIQNRVLLPRDLRTFWWKKDER